MNQKNPYNKFAIVRDMFETPSIIKNFNGGDIKDLIKSIKKTKKLFLTGEGSSRIFPAKNLIYNLLKTNLELTAYAEGARQAAELSLGNFTLLAASNSGKTKEVLSLFKIKKARSKFILTGNINSPLKRFCNQLFILGCGQEKAVSATKSVVEEALFYQNLLFRLKGKEIPKDTLNELSEKSKKALAIKIEKGIVSKLVKANVLYFAGRNNGVAEEAALKTNEITRKKSCYLGGTYAVHGVEEAMGKNEATIVIEPFEEEEQKFKEVLVEGVGMFVTAISSRNTIFPTIRIPSMPGYDGYLQLFACWNLLVELGIALGINLDKPKRARKIGNEI